jgi:enterochelin esterase-like enzyme
VTPRGIRHVVCGTALALLLASCGSAGPARRAGPSSTTPWPPARPQPADPPSCGPVPRGTLLVEHLPSRIIAGDERVQVYLPPGYQQSGGQRPLLIVLLHGAQADETQWVDVGAPAAADCLIASGQIPPMVIAMPDISRFELDRQGASPPLERLVRDELLPMLASRHGVSLDARSLRLGGISRGGGWALRIAAANPTRFCAVGGHSPAAPVDPTGRRALARHHVRVWLDAGDADPTRAVATGLAAQLQALGGDVELHQWAGQHDRRYWSHHVESYLRFYGAPCAVAFAGS